MKFLPNVGITPALGRLSEAEGHSFRYLPDFYWNMIEQPLQEGAFVVIEASSVRIRLLPI